jgi:hypothetical protein
LLYSGTLDTGHYDALLAIRNVESQLRRVMEGKRDSSTAILMKSFKKTKAKKKKSGKK